MQIASYFVVLASNACVYGAGIPVIPSVPIQVLVAALYCALETVFFVQACRLTLKDPTEINTVKTRYFRERGYSVKLAGAFNHYCKICDSVVEPGVHHCKTCQRCVKNLDHHCKWINNCIDTRSIR